MPLVAKDILKPKKIYLPSSADLPEEEKEWVVLEMGPMIGSDVVIVENFTTASGFQFDILAHRLLEWNVRDLDGDVAATTKDNIRRLPKDDLMFLMTEVTTEATVDSLPKELPSS